MRKQTLRLFSAVPLCAILFPLLGYAVETAPRISDREIIESLTRLEEGVKANRGMIESLRTDVAALRTDVGTLRTDVQTDIATLRTDVRAEIAMLRTDMRADIGSLRTEITTLRNELLGFMKWGFGLILSAMFILVGFILWDRRSTVKPVRDQIDELERQKVDRLIAAMKELSEADANVARVLRSVGLL